MWSKSNDEEVQIRTYAPTPLLPNSIQVNTNHGVLKHCQDLYTRLSTLILDDPRPPSPTDNELVPSHPILTRVKQILSSYYRYYGAVQSSQRTPKVLLAGHVSTTVLAAVVSRFWQKAVKLLYASSREDRSACPVTLETVVKDLQVVPGISNPNQDRNA